MSTNGLFISSSTCSERSMRTQMGRLSRVPETIKTASESGKTQIKLNIISQLKFNPYSYLKINVRSISVQLFEHLVDSCDIK